MTDRGESAILKLLRVATETEKSLLRAHDGAVRNAIQLADETTDKSWGTCNVRHRTFSMEKERRVVLVVEDEALLRMTAVESFRELGFQVLEAKCGDEALQIARKMGTIWALFTDIEMPGSVDGLVLSHRFKLKFPHARIVLCSGRKLPAKHELPAGARFVAKPYSLADLQFSMTDDEG